MPRAPRPRAANVRASGAHQPLPPAAEISRFADAVLTGTHEHNTRNAQRAEVVRFADRMIRRELEVERAKREAAEAQRDEWAAKYGRLGYQLLKRVESLESKRQAVGEGKEVEGG